VVNRFYFACDIGKWTTEGTAGSFATAKLLFKTFQYFDESFPSVWFGRYKLAQRFPIPLPSNFTFVTSWKYFFAI
jgi:hypothetical protein